MGCGSSTVESGDKPRRPTEKAKEEQVVAFQPDEDEDDDMSSITPATGPGSRNPKSAISYAKDPTPEETQAAIERSLTLQEEKARTPVSNEVDVFDEPQPFTVEQSPRSSPRMQKSLSNPDGRIVTPTAPAVINKYKQEDSTVYEKKHYFPDSSPTWEADKEEDERHPVWSTGDEGHKRDPLFPSIAVRPAAAARPAEEKAAHLPSIYGSDGKPEPVQLAIVALEQKKMREEHEKNMGSLAYIEQYRNKSQSNLVAD